MTYLNDHQHPHHSHLFVGRVTWWVAGASLMNNQSDLTILQHWMREDVGSVCLPNGKGDAKTLAKPFNNNVNTKKTLNFALGQRTHPNRKYGHVFWLYFPFCYTATSPTRWKLSFRLIRVSRSLAAMTFCVEKWIMFLLHLPFVHWNWSLFSFLLQC